MRVLHLFFGAIAFLAAVAAFSRIVTIPKMNKTIEAGANALAKLFNGAFGF